MGEPPAVEGEVTKIIVVEEQENDATDGARDPDLLIGIVVSGLHDVIVCGVCGAVGLLVALGGWSRMWGRIA